MTEVNQHIDMWAGEDAIILVHMPSNIDFDAIDKVRWKMSESLDENDEPEVTKWSSIEDSGGGPIDIRILPDQKMFRIVLHSRDTITKGGERFFHETRIWSLKNQQATVSVGRIKIRPSAYAHERAENWPD